MDRARAKRALADTSLAYEVSGDVWRAKAYKRAAQLIDAMRFSTGAAATSPSSYLVNAERPQNTPGFGPSSAAIVRYVARHPEFCDLSSSKDALCVPPPHDSVVDRRKLGAYKLFRGVLSIGHAAALRAVNEHGARTLTDLLASYQNSGSRVPELVRLGTRFYRDLNTKIPRVVAEEAIMHVRRAISRACKSLTVDDVVPLGSFRRGKQEVGDIDLLVTRPGTDMSALAKALSEELHRDETDDCGSFVAPISNGRRKFSFLYRSSSSVNKTRRVMRVDVFSVRDHQEAPFFMIHGTGSASHNEFLRQIARKTGLTLNEYGLFDAKTRRRVHLADDDDTALSERDVYAALGVPYVPPERRD